MIKIWGRTDSSNVQKVLWCLGELGLPFERQDWGGKFGGNKDNDYLACLLYTSDAADEL